MVVVSGKKRAIPHDILEQTSQCKHSFSCLDTGRHHGPDGCEVDYLYGENILFLKSRETDHSCPYRAHFNGSQMCLCPTKYHICAQNQEENFLFSSCSNCSTAWQNYHDFLSDPYISLHRYQVSFEELEAGMFSFHHSCGVTLQIPVRELSYLYDGPIFQKRKTGTDTCPAYCLRAEELRPCPEECECAYVQEVLQIVKNWPKRVSSLPSLD